MDYQMFVVVRSVFWLAVAYMVIRPGVDLPDGNAVAAQAMAAGSQVVSEQINRIECTDITCAGGKAVFAAALQSSPSVGLPMHVMPTSSLAPIPRPRPDWAG
ncbi:MAG: hypothetical protein ACI9GK_001536 [Devosia sp.]|jgi:hypothetical protein|tara:strand:- start:18 stop:323 length:306 start_codon:yes stop_codon:yes gene_type:complete